MLDAIWKRKSVRVFDQESLSKEDIDMILDLLVETNDSSAPFGHQINFFSIDGAPFDGQKLGTYGTVKHPSMVIGGFTEVSFDGFLDYGYLLEQLVLKITKLDIASVWEEGRFDPALFNQDEVSGKMIPAICPLGYPKGKVLKKRQIHINPKKEQRKDIRELAFVGKKLKPMNESDQYHEHIRAVQIAPSGSNKQPWRFVVIDQAIHMYLEPTKGYGQNLPKDIQAIDMGIALRHLTYSLTAQNTNYTIERNKNVDYLKNAQYVCTVKIEK